MDSPKENDKKPRFFAIIGWSWFVFGLLGLAFGLLSLPSLFRMDQMKEVLMRPELRQVPFMAQSIETLLTYYAPFTIFKILSSFIMVAAGWEFLKRKDWARLALSALNGIMMLSFVGFFYLFARWFNAAWVALRGPEMVEAGLVPNYPPLVNGGMFIGAILLLAPLLWMTWWFHSKNVRAFFSSP